MTCYVLDIDGICISLDTCVPLSVCRWTKGGFCEHVQAMKDLDVVHYDRVVQPSGRSHAVPLAHPVVDQTEHDAMPEVLLSQSTATWHRSAVRDVVSDRQHRSRRSITTLGDMHADAWETEFPRYTSQVFVAERTLGSGMHGHTEAMPTQVTPAQRRAAAAAAAEARRLASVSDRNSGGSERCESASEPHRERTTRCASIPPQCHTAAQTSPHTRGTVCTSIARPLREAPTLLQWQVR